MNPTVEKLIAENKISQAIRKLHHISKYDSELKIEVIQLSARYEDYLSQKRLNISDESTSQVELAKIRKALIDIGGRIDESKKPIFSIPNGLKNKHFKFPIQIIAFASVIGIGFFIYGMFTNNLSDPVEIQNETEPRTSEISYYSNEKAAHEDIKQGILTSQKVKLYLVRGKKLFNDDDGLFFLNNYHLSDVNPLFNCNVLLLDFDSLSQNQYSNMTKNVNLVWGDNLGVDRATQKKSVQTIKSLKEGSGFDIKVREYMLSDFQYFKMFIFDDFAYFTIYHKIGSAKEHQQYTLVRTKKGDPLYRSLEAIFDASWEKANET